MGRRAANAGRAKRAETPASELMRRTFRLKASANDAHERCQMGVTTHRVSRIIVPCRSRVPGGLIFACPMRDGRLTHSGMHSHRRRGGEILPVYVSQAIVIVSAFVAPGLSRDHDGVGDVDQVSWHELGQAPWISATLLMISVNGSIDHLGPALGHERG